MSTTHPMIPVASRRPMPARRFRRLLVLLLAFALVAAACGDDDDNAGGDAATDATAAADTDEAASDDAATDETGGDPVTLTLVTHDSFAVSDGIFDTFTAETGIGVEVLSAGDAGEIVSRAVLTAGDPEGDVLFALSDSPARFYDFASYFREILKTPNALYLDGTISRLYAPALDRNDPGADMGPIIGVVERHD